MKKCLFAACAIFTLIAPCLQAQLNENKIERDASGIYRGAIQGGALVYISGGVPSTPYITHKETGKFKLPVKDGKANSTLKDTDLPEGSAACQGKWKKTKVQRGGKKIALQGTGTLDADNETNTKWTNGKTSGSLTDRGPKWNADCKVSARQDVPEQGDPMDPYPGYTQIITGLKVEGAQ